MSLSFRSTEIRDARLRSVAETVDKHVGKKGDREITASDLDDAAKLVEKHKAAVAAGTPEKSPLKDVHAVAVRQLEEALPELRKLLHAEAPAKRAAPFATSLGTSAIADDGVRSCAQAICKALDGKDELSLASFLDARDVFKNQKTDGGKAETSAVRKALEPFIKDGTITQERLDALDVFFLTGQGGIMSHGPIRISGRSFDDCYKLPRLNESDGKTVAAYEERFANCGYDRIYIKGDDGDIYVALNEKGSLEKQVDAGYRVSMRNDLHKRDSGEVLEVVDVSNSLREATVGVWRKKVTQLADAAFGAIGKKADKRIDDAAGSIADAVIPDASRNNKKDLATIALALTGASAYGVLVYAVPVALIGAGLAILGITGASVAKYAMAHHDKAAIFHAIGVGVNQAERVT